MSVSIALLLFCGCLGLSIVASAVLAERIDQLGIWIGLSEGLLGLLTALAADAPEVTSSVTAIIAGNHDLGLGVVFGSNIFNLAALMGLGAITAGTVRVRPAGLWFDGGVGLVVAIVVAARLFGWIGSAAAVAVVVVILVPYLLISALKPGYLERLSMRPSLKRVLQRILATSEHEKRKDQTPEKPSVIDLLGVVPSLFTVVIASVGMVNSAIVLGKGWHVPNAVIGMLVLATLTGIPNTLAAIRLARHGRGTAVISETLNSNSVNLIVGALIPTLIFGVGTIDPRSRLAIVWSIAMTLFALILATFRGGLTRISGAVLVLVYAVFVLVVLL
jgi:cation:H+ antiporter